MTPFATTRIQQAGTNECVGILADPFTAVQNAAQINCSSSPAPSPWILHPGIDATPVGSDGHAVLPTAWSQSLGWPGPG